MGSGSSIPAAERPRSGSRGGKRLLPIVIAVLVAVSGAAVYVVLSKPSSQPVRLDRVKLSTATGPNSLDESAQLLVSAKAFDTNGVDETRNTTIAWSASPQGIVDLRPRTLPAPPYRILFVFGLRAGSVTITAYGTWSNSSKAGTGSVMVNPVQLALAASNSYPLVGVGFTLTVRAVRPDSTPVTAYNGTVHFSSDDPAASLPGNTNFSFSDLGVKIFRGVVINKSGPVRVSAQDVNSGVNGSVTLSGNQAPHAAFAITPDPQDPQDARRIIANASASFDPNSGDKIVYAWEFGDATTGTEPILAHTYRSSGSYAVNLTVTDNHGASNWTSKAYVAHAPPSAIFFIDRQVPNGANFIEVWFNASKSTGGDGTLVGYHWTFGDQTQADSVTALSAHNYSASLEGSSVFVALRVTNNYAFTNTTSLWETISVEILPPVPTFSISIDNRTRTVSVDGSKSSSPIGRAITGYNWTWGDGSWSGNRSSAYAVHTYSADRTYTITLEVWDSGVPSLSNTTFRTAWVQRPPLPPDVYFAVNRTLMHVDVDASATSDLNDNIATYGWDWGDGATESGPSPVASHTYSAPNKYRITLTVTDTTGLANSTSRYVSVGPSTIDYTYYDFFNVPYGEWWDYRYPAYGDLPLGKECFNATSIRDGVCRLNPRDWNRDGILTALTGPPYTDWYPEPGGDLHSGTSTNNPFIYAPYRFAVTASNVGGYNVMQPVILPLCTDLAASLLSYPACPSSLPAGSSVNVQWDFQYLDNNSANWVDSVCFTQTATQMDGFIAMSNITLKMDLATASRIFGSPATSASAARTWWSTNADSPSGCGIRKPVSNAYQNWLQKQGGSSSASGPYDIYSSYQYFYSPFQTHVVGNVSSDGSTTVKILHVAWGTEALLARWFYWGSTPYLTNYLDSSTAKGWWGMELAWFEDFHFNATLASDLSFTLRSVMQYHLQLTSLTGPDGVYRGQQGERGDDIPVWSWGPILSDYIPYFSSAHPASELSRYPSPHYGYLHTTPGSPQFGQNESYDFVPVTWDLKAGQTWHFDFPRGKVIFYDPNLSPFGASPTNSTAQGGYVSTLAPMTYAFTQPAGYGIWDSRNMTWDVYGPSVTGGPPGTPGLDHTPGTSDDQYPLVLWGAITFADPPISSSSFSRSIDTRSTSVTAATSGFDAIRTSAIATWTIEPNSKQVTAFGRRRL